jgi:hypothetical protein
MGLRVTIQGVYVEGKALRIGFPYGSNFLDDLVLWHVLLLLQ